MARQIALENDGKYFKLIIDGRRGCRTCELSVATNLQDCSVKDLCAAAAKFITTGPGQLAMRHWKEVSNE